MSYGHTTLFFATAVEAQDYLDSCRRGNNYTAENYQDRVSAQNCIAKAAGWAPAPIVDFERPPISQAPFKRRRAS